MLRYRIRRECFFQFAAHESGRKQRRQHKVHRVADHRYSGKLAHQRNILALINRRSNQHDPSYFLRIIDRIDKRQRAAPGMTDKNRALDMELLERVVKQTRLNFDGYVDMLRPLATPMARTIDSDDPMNC